MKTTKIVCDKCGGRGTIYATCPVYIPDTIICPHCNGKGYCESKNQSNKEVRR